MLTLPFHVYVTTLNSNLFRVSYQANPDVKNLLSYDISIDLKRACTLEPDPLFLSGTLRHYVKKRELAGLLVNRKETSHPSWGQ